MSLLQDTMWRGGSKRLALSKGEARGLRQRGEFLAAHSLMLSTLYSILGGRPENNCCHHPLSFYPAAAWHALCMLQAWQKLNHNQLDVLIQFLLKIRARLPAATGRPMVLRWLPWPGKFLLMLAERETVLAIDARLPHQRALAIMTLAEVQYAVDFSVDEVRQRIEGALSFEEQIRREPQPQGLRQLVRIFKKAGQLYMKPGLSSKNNRGKLLIIKAANLASGEAQTPDQAEKIKEILRKLL